MRPWCLLVSTVSQVAPVPHGTLYWPRKQEPLLWQNLKSDVSLSHQLFFLSQIEMEEQGLSQPLQTISLSISKGRARENVKLF